VKHRRRLHGGKGYFCPPTFQSRGAKVSFCSPTFWQFQH